MHWRSRQGVTAHTRSFTHVRTWNFNSKMQWDPLKSFHGEEGSGEALWRKNWRGGRTGAGKLVRPFFGVRNRSNSGNTVEHKVLALMEFLLQLGETVDK